LLDGAHLVGTIHGRRLNVDFVLQIELAAIEIQFLPAVTGGYKKAAPELLVGKNLPGRCAGGEDECVAAIARGKASDGYRLA
jgi:hypothetical protein